MTSLSQLFTVYVIGGLTFIPLVLAAVLLPAWFNLPKVEQAGDLKKDDAVDEKNEKGRKAGEELQAPSEEQYGSDGEDGTASGIFAVLRKYDLPAALTALAARSGQHAGGTANGTDGAADVLQGSESVYQSMYRSVFDRSRTATPLNGTPDDDSGSTTDSKTKRKQTRPAQANTFFIVLRHGHLMLYDSSAQLEVRHVVSLAHHAVSLSDGESDVSDKDEPMTDGDLFIKRTAILLTPLAAVANGALQAQAVPPKPFYLFASTSIQKESFYHALLLASTAPPIAQPLDPHDLIRLQTTLHSTIMTPETRALNAIISRIYLALSGTDLLKDFFRAKIEKKISRVQKPGFINSLALQAIDLGAAAPVVANLRLKDLNVSGDVTASCDVRYTGGISLTFAAQARLDLGPRFKARTVDLLLSSSLKRLSGHMLIRIKPPPSNRLWFCFDGMPDMEIKIEPVVSSRQITYGFILRQIEERIRAVVAETLVKPNWDDISFFDTRSQRVRGGLWSDEGGRSSSGEATPNEADMLARKGEKTMSMPVLPHMDDAGGASSGTDTPRREHEAEIKRRSVASLPAQTTSTPYLGTIDSEERANAPAQAPRPIRSPSLTSPAASAPSVALDDSSANFDPSHKPLPQKARTWGRRQVPPPSNRKEAVDAVREVRDRTFHMQDTGSGGENANDRDTLGEDEDSLASGTATPERTSTGFSTSSTSTTAPSVRSESGSVRGKKAANLFAAATTATTAAKNWSWNAIQNQRARNANAAGRRTSEASAQEPMGRGQPLPPPGMPLPGPQREKSLWAGSGFGVPGLSGSVKRKPVLPRRPTAQDGEGNANERSTGKGSGEVDEFGAWEENSGGVGKNGEVDDGAFEGDEVQGKRVPPPLPQRRRTGHESVEASAQDREPVEKTSNPALNAARLASATPLAHPSTSHRSEEADSDTTSSQLTSASSDDLATPMPPSNDPPALPARPATSSFAEGNDPEDLVVVAAPVESGRNTPVPPHLMDSEPERSAESNWPEGNDGRERERGGYDGEGWGHHDDVDEEEEEEEEGMPKASFSRSRGDEGELHL